MIVYFKYTFPFLCFTAFLAIFLFVSGSGKPSVKIRLKPSRHVQNDLLLPEQLENKESNLEAHDKGRKKEAQGIYIENYYIADFDSAMIGNDKDKHIYTKLNASNKGAKKLFDLARTNYNKYMFDRSFYRVEPRIPKIIHQIWVGGVVPEKYVSFMETWKQLHPDWIYKLWTDEDIEDLNMINKKYFDQAKKGAEKADILRYELICRFGGVYVDIDFKCFKPLDLFHHMCDFYSAFHYLKLQKYGRVANGLLAAQPGHPILEHAVNEIKNHRHHKELMYRAGPDFFTFIIKRVLPKLEGINIIFPANYFYPYGESKDGSLGLHNIKDDGKIFSKPETVAAHFFEKNW